MAGRRRLDAELVRRGLARSREHAATLIAAGSVTVSGMVATKAATAVAADAPIVVDESAQDDPGYASRGGHKLAGALQVFRADGLSVAGRLALDAGASTGGFTDVLLRAGVARVLAVDVGYGQLAWALRTDQRVEVFERTNVRDLTVELLHGRRPDLVVGDLSFISLTLVLPALLGVATPDADLVLMVKPQFEVGRGRLGKGGVVRDPEQRASAVMTVADAGWELGVGTAGCVASPLPGPTGNVEYFLWLRRGAAAPGREQIEGAVAAGPT